MDNLESAIKDLLEKLGEMESAGVEMPYRLAVEISMGMRRVSNLLENIGDGSCRTNEN